VTLEPVLTPERIAELRVGYDAGLTTVELAAKYGISETSVRRAVPVRRRRGPRTARDVSTSTIVTLREEAGCSFGEIAEALGVPKNTVVSRYYRYLRKLEDA
jgi:DNA-binding transcriptional regulator YiaG